MNSTPAAPRHLLLRSSWQSVNIGDIAHTPGMLALLSRHLPATRITLWPTHLLPEIATALRQRFPQVSIAATEEDQARALADCDLVLHGSGPGLVGIDALRRARAAGKPYAIGGITLSDEEIATEGDLLAGARHVALRDTASLAALRASLGERVEASFGPDATFALDLADGPAAARILAEHGLEPGRFLCVIPRLRWTPYWEIHPERIAPNPVRSAVNERFADRDHAKLRRAIVAWVRETGLPVLVCPEMSYAVPRLRPLLVDDLPADVLPQVRVLDRYWVTNEAFSTYAQAATILSSEQHSPIMAIASGVPAVLVRQPTDTRKGQMWRDIGLEPWIFEVDAATGDEIAATVLTIAGNPAAARAQAEAGRQRSQAAMAAMVAAIAHCGGKGQACATASR